MRIAAGIVVAAGLSLLASSVWPRPSSARAALQEVGQAVARSKTVRFTLRPADGGGPAPAVQFRLLAPGLARVDEPGGGYSITDVKAGRTLRVDPKARVARLMAAHRRPRAGEGFDLDEFFREIERFRTKALPNRSIDGVEAVGFEARAEAPDAAPQVVRVWVHPETKRPLRMELGAVAADGAHSYGIGPAPTVVAEGFAFDEPMDPADFALEPPAGYRLVEDLGAGPRPAPAEPDRAAPTFTPGVGLGPVTFGMGREEIVRRLGEPDRVAEVSPEPGATIVTLEYGSRGYWLIVDAGKRGLVQILLNTERFLPARTRDFAGRTDKGIGMGASRREILDAHGRPDLERTQTRREALGADAKDPDAPFGPTTMIYRDLGTNFVLDADRLIHVIAEPGREGR